MREEINYLNNLPRANVQTQGGTDEYGIPDGSYNLMVTLPRPSGGLITLYMSCLAGYPQSPPAVEVELDGQMTPFQSAILRRWQGQYLVEIAREAKQWFG